MALFSDVRCGASWEPQGPVQVHHGSKVFLCRPRVGTLTYTNATGEGHALMALLAKLSLSAGQSSSPKKDDV